MARAQLPMWASGLSALVLCTVLLVGSGWSSMPSILDEVVDVLPKGTTPAQLNQVHLQLANTIVKVPVCSMGSCRQHDACMDRCVLLIPL